MAVRPIPRRLLVHDLIYHEFIEDEEWKESFQAPITIQNVLFQPVTGMNRTMQGEEVEMQASTVLFIDRVNSSNYVRMIEKSKVYRADEPAREMRVIRVDELFTDSPNSHHFEVGLI